MDAKHRGMKMSVGIDYGMGRTNINHATGIRYGVISQHSVTQAWADSAEADYGKPTCPKCGNTVNEYEHADRMDAWEFGDGCCDYVCESCEYIFDSGEAFGDEPIGWNYDDDGYTLVDCLDSDIMILNSPYYTKAIFCSPCVPGACSIESPDEDGAKAYCLGHDWFEDGKAPYPVYSVATNELLAE